MQSNPKYKMEEIKIMSEIEMENFSIKLNTFIRQGKWDKAEKILLKNIQEYPDEYYSYTMLSQVYSGKRDYKEAFKYAEKAMDMNPADPLVIYNYIKGLLRFDKIKDAISLLCKIINMGIKELALGQYGEGLKYGKSLFNDSVALMGYDYFDLGDKQNAKKYFKKHLKLRQRGIYSDFTKKQIEDELAKCE